MKRITIALLLCLLLVGCNFGIVYVDPPVRYEKGGLVIEGDPYVELGLYEEQLYVAFEDGDAAPVVHGLQGGTWTHPALRTTGIGTPAVVDCSLITDDGEQVGFAQAVTNFFVGVDGFLEVQSYPLPILHTAPGKGPEIDDLYGVGATLSCAVTDLDGRGSQASVALFLEQG